MVNSTSKSHARRFGRRMSRDALVAVASADMLTCGEDLGTVPPVVPVVEAELGILSLMIDRWHRDNENYHYLSVCSTSTHDMANIRQWWEEDAEETQKYYEECLGMKGKAPEKLTGEVARKIVGRMLHSSSVLAILPIQVRLPKRANPSIASNAFAAGLFCHL